MVSKKANRYPFYQKTYSLIERQLPTKNIPKLQLGKVSFWCCLYFLTNSKYEVLLIKSWTLCQFQLFPPIKIYYRMHKLLYQVNVYLVTCQRKFEQDNIFDKDYNCFVGSKSLMIKIGDFWKICFINFLALIFLKTITFLHGQSKNCFW